MIASSSKPPGAIAPQRGLKAVNQQLLALQAASASVAAASNRDDLPRLVADGIVQTLGYKYVALSLVTADQKRFALEAISGMPLALLEQVESLAGMDLTRMTLALDEMANPALQALQAGEVFVTQDAAQMLHPPFPQSVCRDLQELAGINALAALPLLSRGRLLGGILVVSEQPTFSPAEINVLRAFADLAAAAIDNARLQASVAAAEERANLLLDIQSAIAARLELYPILNLVVGGAVGAVNATSGLLALVDPNTQELAGQAGHGLPVDAEPSAVRLSLTAGTLGQVVATGRSARVDDVRTLPSTDQWAAQLRLHNLVVVPIRLSNRVIGVLSVHDQRSGRPFTANDEGLLAAIADQAAVAIEQARLYEELRRRAQEQAALNLIAETAGRSLELQEVLETSLERVLDVTGLAGGVIYMPDETGARLILAAHRNAQGNLLHRLAALQADNDLAGEVFRTGRPLLLKSPAAAARVPVFVAAASHPVSFAAVPLRAKGETLGVMVVGGFAPHLLAERDLDLLTAIGNQVGLAVENARLYAEAQQRVRELALLNGVATAASESLDLDAVLAQTLSHVQALTRADRLAVYLREGDASAFALRATSGFPEAAAADGQGPPTTLPFAQVMPHEVMVLNVPTSPNSPMETYLHAQGLRSAILVPLRSRGVVVGSIHLLFTAPRVLGAAEQQLLDTVSRQVSAAVENARLYQETRRMALTDGLTGLYNYRYFYETLGREIERVRRYDGHLSLVMLDLDDFKEYNDAHGHLAGDDLLVDLADLLRGQIRVVDTAARYGGEEIAILLPETDRAGAQLVAERIRRAVAEHEFVARGTLAHARITVSVGVGVFPDDATEARALVHAADMALYVAKRAGKNCVRLAGAAPE